MKRGKTRWLIVCALVFVLAFSLAGGALAGGKPEPAGGSRWIVAFDDAVAVNEAAREAIVKGAGGVIEEDLGALNMAIVLLPIQAEKGLEAAEGVRRVEKDSYRYYHLQTLPWGIDRIDAEYAWAGSTGDGVNVAVLDTGIDTDHPDLAANLEGGYSCINRDTSDVEDKNGHGTHCSGIIAALNNEIGVVGVGPDIDLWMVQISRGTRIRLTDILEGINWCIGTLDGPNPIQVMSMSFGGGYSQSENSALQTAYDKGIVLVSSAGNQYGGAVTYPAALSQVIAVSAVDKYNQIASFSSTGSEVELAAPGVDIYSTYKGGSYETLSGTSMACPHVSGVAALVIGSGITDANDLYGIADEVRGQLQLTAEDIWLTSDKQGYGLVDAENAVLGTTTGDNLAIDTGTIAGKVTDTDGAAIENATVTVEGTNLSDKTDVNGDYAIYEVPVGTYTVTASAEGYESQSVTDVTVTKDTTTTVNFALTEAVAPTGTMYVESITFDSKVAGPNKFLYTFVKVVDGDGYPLKGVGVKMTLDWDKENDEIIDDSWNFAGDTGTDDTVKFTLLKAPSGYYAATVTSLILTDYTWDTAKGVISASCQLQ